MERWIRLLDLSSCCIQRTLSLLPTRYACCGAYCDSPSIRWLIRRIVVSHIVVQNGNQCKRKRVNDSQLQIANSNTTVTKGKTLKPLGVYGSNNSYRCWAFTQNERFLKLWKLRHLFSVSFRRHIGILN